MRLPNDSQRITIVGRTGSGKTQAAVWQLSLRSFDSRPWIVYDFKRDTLINSIAGATQIDLSDPLPKEPGVYVVHPLPDEIEGVQQHLWKIWAQENVGVYVDEGYMMSTPAQPNPPFRALLTQGRSKNIPIIILSQRPVWLDRFVFSESDYYQVFALNDARDRKTITSFVPADLDKKLPDFHSYYYDVGADKLLVIKPVPTADEILSTFAARFDAMKDKGARRLNFV